ncbi:MAG: SPW repeat protein [Anaerolineae bacterium]|nr:SPW repeat protein [Anaerolineae bacterium]
MKSKMFWLTGLLGVLLILAPFVLNYRDDANAQWSHIILGAVILIVSIIEAVDQSTSNWEYWAAGLGGVVAILAPFLFNFRSADQATQMWTSIILGALLVIVSGYEVLLKQPAEPAR